MGTKVEMKGRLYAVGPVEEFASGFRKRTVVVRNEGTKFEDLLAFELKSERTGLVKPEDKGREVSVTGYAGSRSWTDPKTGKAKWFTSVDAVEVKFGAAAAPKSGEAEAVSEIAAKIGADESPADDMPF